MKVTAIIEKNENSLFSVYVAEDLPGFDLNGQGYTVEEAKKEFLCVYEEMKELFAEEGKTIPTIEFEYKYDIPSIFNEFNMINVSKFAESIGINPGLMRRYVCGDTFASEKQAKKIKDGMISLGNKLTAIV